MPRSHERFVAIDSIIPWDELEQRVRDTPLLKDPSTLPYRDATITLAEVFYPRDPAEAADSSDRLTAETTSLYVARTLLRRQAQIIQDISGDGYHPLELDCGLRLVSSDTQGQEQFTNLVPPIVEHSEADGNYLLDGSHRANQGRWQGRESFYAIYIRDIDPDCPCYAEPNSWDEVKIYDEPPEDPVLRKRYRISKRGVMGDYRNFKELNGSTPRSLQ